MSLADKAFVHAHGWGERLLQSAQSVRTAWLEKHNIVDSKIGEAVVNVGTDCSGAEGPISALKGLNLKFKQKWACEVADHAREWIVDTCGLPAELLWSDMVSRDHAALPVVCAYYCGFPCKPWSRLNNHSRFWQDPNARPFEDWVWASRTQSIKPCSFHKSH